MMMGFSGEVLVRRICLEDIGNTSQFFKNEKYLNTYSIRFA
jgi:hypothetical protein